jgi:hypothetical protein
VLNALLQAGRARLSAVLPALEGAFADRSIMASVTDPVFAGALRQAHWDGALRDDGGDYLAVFDQNVTDSKLNPFVDQQISYDATRRSDGGLDSRVTVTYANHTAHTAVWIGRAYYQDYVRIAVPAASRLRDQVGYDDAFWPDESERGRRLITGGLLVPAGATRTISISYTVPASALAGGSAYTLVVQKQSGSRPALLSVRVHEGGKTWAARTWLRRDMVFSVSWEAPAGNLMLCVSGDFGVYGCSIVTRSSRRLLLLARIRWR